MTQPPTKRKPPIILAVDDELSLLKSLERLFRNEPVELHTALGGMKAIEMLEKTKYDLVLSDMRMPDMDGAALLQRVYDFYPESIRMLISGYSDHDLLVKAINDGRVHAFIEKPWNNKQLVSKVKAALADRSLTATDSTDDRDAERKPSEAIKSTPPENKVAVLKLIETMQTRMPGQWAHAKRVAETSRLFARYLSLTSEQQNHCYLTGRFYCIGRLLLSDELNNKAEYLLSKDEHHSANKHYELGEALLLLDPDLKPVINTIRQIDMVTYREQEAIEAQIVSMVIYFDKLVSGLLLKQPVTSRKAQEMIRDLAGDRFDRELVSHFLMMLERRDHGELKDGVRVVSVNKLQPGMTLMEPLVNSLNQVLLKAGTVLTTSKIEKIMAHETSRGEPLTLYVK